MSSATPNKSNESKFTKENYPMTAKYVPFPWGNEAQNHFDLSQLLRDEISDTCLHRWTACVDCAIASSSAPGEVLSQADMTKCRDAQILFQGCILQHMDNDTVSPQNVFKRHCNDDLKHRSKQWEHIQRYEEQQVQEVKELALPLKRVALIQNGIPKHVASKFAPVLHHLWATPYSQLPTPMQDLKNEYEEALQREQVTSEGGVTRPPTDIS